MLDQTTPEVTSAIQNHKQTSLGELDTLSSEARAILLARARVRKFDANDVVHYQNDPTTHFFIVLKGHVRINHIAEDGFVTLSNIVAPGQCFGESGVLDGCGYCHTASASDTVEVLAIETSFITGRGAAYEEIRLEVSRMIARRYRKHVVFSRGLHLPNLAQRLSYTMVNLFQTLGNDVKHQGKAAVCLGPEVKQCDLGSMARGTRENVNKTLRRWQKDGVLALEDRHILLLDPERLEEIALSLD